MTILILIKEWKMITDDEALKYSDELYDYLMRKCDELRRSNMCEAGHCKSCSMNIFQEQVSDLKACIEAVNNIA
jgi:hypothetical protein